MTHIPTPYNAEYAEDSDALLISAAPNERGWGAEICTVADESTAEFIVKACNSHAKLVEALEEVRALNEDVLNGKVACCCWACIDVISDALGQLKENN